MTVTMKILVLSLGLMIFAGVPGIISSSPTTPQQKRGLDIYINQGRCVSCHAVEQTQAVRESRSWSTLAQPAPFSGTTGCSGNWNSHFLPRL
jgi:hypothetical protein